MAAEHTDKTDPSLSKTLRLWKMDASLPPRFTEQVWQRISLEEAQEPRSLWFELGRRLSQMMARPALAAGYVTVLLAAGLLGGYWQARVSNTHISAELSARYVQMMDPYQARSH